MKFLAAVLLAALSGNTSPSTEDIKCILSSVGAEWDEDRVEFLMKQLEGKNLVDMIAVGREKFASVPSGGGVAVAVTGGGGGAAAPAAVPEAEAKKEEKVEEKEESDDDMGFSLFD